MTTESAQKLTAQLSPNVAATSGTFPWPMSLIRILTMQNRRKSWRLGVTNLSAQPPRFDHTYMPAADSHVILLPITSRSCTAALYWRLQALNKLHPSPCLNLKTCAVPRSSCTQPSPSLEASHLHLEHRSCFWPYPALSANNNNEE